MTQWLERLLSLRRGDIGRGSLLFLYYFLIIAGYVSGQIARDALFLDRFEAVQLPYPDIVIAAGVGLVVAAYLRLARALPHMGLLAGSLLVFASTAFLFWWGLNTVGWDWLYAALYIWVGVFGVLAITQVWTLANFKLTTREAKRVFGLVGSGGILGGIFGSFVSRNLAATLGTSSILLALGLSLVGCAGIVVLIGRQGDRDTPARSHADSSDRPVSFIESVRLVAQSPHLRSIAALICVGSIVTTLAGWQFKAVSAASFQDTDQLAVFFADILMYTGIIAFAAQVLVTSRVLQRFGVGVALLILPTALALGTTSVLIWGNLLAVTLLRSSDKVLRYSIDTAALQLLYLPVPTHVKVGVKSLIDTVIVG